MSSSESEIEEFYSDDEYESDPDQGIDWEGKEDEGTEQQHRSGSYMNAEPGPQSPMPAFKPKLVPGLHLPCVSTRGKLQKFLTPFSIFKLFFTVELVQHLCNFTNQYARQHGPDKPSLYSGWTDVTVADFYSYIALLMYMAISQEQKIEQYWSTASQFHGLLAHRFMSQHRFKAIQSFLKVSNPRTENPNDKLCKVRFLYDYIKRKCMKLYQPYKNVAADERMVRNRGRFSFRQFIKDKPTRWGMKVWVLVDSKTGYTYNYEIYTGKGGVTSKHGLAYDVVMRLCQSLFGQGYCVSLDNFYTDVQLLKDLLLKKTVCCGTLRANCKGVPAEFRQTREFAKSPRGYMRWRREGDLLFVQWLDNKPVTFLSTMHRRGNAYDHVKRQTKVNGKRRAIHVRQPKLVKDYNVNMSGVDKSDQLISRYEIPRKTNRWWKTLFFHFLDVARVNSFILFNDLCEKSPDIEVLHWEKSYNQLDFTIELIREMAGISYSQNIDLILPQCQTPPSAMRPAPACPTLKPIHSAKPKNCVLCYSKTKKELKTIVKCETCGKHLCFQTSRNCLKEYHFQ